MGIETVSVEVADVPARSLVEELDSVLAVASAAVVTTLAANSALQALSCQVLFGCFSYLIDSPAQLVS